MPDQQEDLRPFDYARLEAYVLSWARSRPDMRAAAVMGSRGRAMDYTADTGSDLDLLLVTTEPDSYRNTAWLAEIGPVVSAVFDPNDHVAFAGSLDFFTVFADGHDADFALLPYSYVQSLIQDSATRQKDLLHLIKPVFARGMRVLFDHAQLIPRLAAAFETEELPFVRPAEEAFIDHVENFWQGVLRIAKKLRAGHLFYAMRWYQGQRGDLIRLAEWHARLTRELPPSTWYRDKYLEQWADPRLVTALPRLYPQYDAADIRRSLFTMMEIFRMLARETATHLEYPYPERSDREIAAWVGEYLPA
jgi:aminoglycoside 6-adenylyltransferase